MIKKIAHGYGRLFSSILKIVFLAAICLGLSFIVVYPLWKWALSSPTSYTGAILVLALIFIVYATVKAIKKNGVMKFLHALSKILVILGGLTGCILFVLNGRRLIALAVLVATFIIYGVLAFGFRSDKMNENVSSKN